MTASIGPAMPLLIAPHIRRVAVIYDFIPAEYPTNYLRSATDRICYQARYLALQAYHAFLPISEASKSALCSRLGHAGSALVVNSGVANPLQACLAGTSASMHGLSERYILAPTGGDARKNLAIVIAAEAFNRAKGREPNRIVVVGGLTERQRKSLMKLSRKSHVPSEDITFLSGVSAEDLNSIYRNALICIVPSFAEGFSIPIAESVNCGTAVVASDIPAHRELLGIGSWLAVPSSVIDMARAMRTTIKNKDRVLQSQKANLRDRAEPASVRDRIATLFRQLLSAAPTSAHIESSSRADPRRPRIAVVTPWPPQRSGIADYSRHTMTAVSASADVAILTNDLSELGQDAADERLTIREVDASTYLDPQYDRVLTVLGNSHFHLPGLEYLLNLGGPVLAHDNRMIEFYCYLFGPARTAQLLSTVQTSVNPSQVENLLLDLDNLPSLGYAEIGRVARPLLVHSRSLQHRLAQETGADVKSLPFVPYRQLDIDNIDHDVRRAARQRRGIDDGVLNVATFGIVDRRTKGVDLVLDAMAWLDLWKIPARLHYVGAVLPRERSLLEDLAAQANIHDQLVFHDHLDQDGYRDMLLAVDVAVQLRISSILTLSGALLDCIAFGVPTIATQSIAAEVDAPAFVTTIPDKVSPLLMAEGIVANAGRRRTQSEKIDNERLAYLSENSAARYAAALLKQLKVDVRAAE